MTITPMRWEGDHLMMLDQRELPHREIWLALTTPSEVAGAIRNMTVRGAPAIGIAAAYGMVLAAQQDLDMADADRTLAESRPTAVNLFWALQRMRAHWQSGETRLLEEARAIETQDLAMNLAIGQAGAELIPLEATVLTICNTGALATAGHGTALGIIRSAFSQGKIAHVYACETRPRQQGLRLTAYELLKEGIPFQSIADSVAASLMRQGKVNCVVAGADRIAANGDTANKIGTYMLAVLANYHKVPFYIAAPTSTLDPSLANGDLIPIEERAATELTESEGIPIAPVGTPVFNPAFDVTPGELIDAIVTEKGVFRRPYCFA